ncbi:PRC-barrel domain-containing protein [Rhodopila sp.]|uniref:PRC-barrel domain-containing protein n=1 Tax=Rhodopila sp. TaxID=2480087 RepID=UPI003D0B1EDA
MQRSSFVIVMLAMLLGGLPVAAEVTPPQVNQPTAAPQPPSTAVQPTTAGTTQSPPRGAAQAPSTTSAPTTGVPPAPGATQAPPPAGAVHAAPPPGPATAPPATEAPSPPQGTAAKAAPASGAAEALPPATASPPPPPAKSAVQSVSPEAAEAILGQRVTDQEGKDIGRLVDVLVNVSGQPQAAVIDFGGFMGVGNRKIAVHWGALHFTPGDPKRKVTLEMTPDQIKAAPEFLNTDKAAPVVTPANTAAASP